MKNRRKDQDILRYLPFNEFDDVNNNLEAQNGHIHKRLKAHSIINKKTFYLFIKRFLF